MFYSNNNFEKFLKKEISFSGKYAEFKDGPITDELAILAKNDDNAKKILFYKSLKLIINVFQKNYEKIIDKDPNVDLNELLSMAFLNFDRAVQLYKPESAASFLTYLNIWIREVALNFKNYMGKMSKNHKVVSLDKKFRDSKGSEKGTVGAFLASDNEEETFYKEKFVKKASKIISSMKDDKMKYIIQARMGLLPDKESDKLKVGGKITDKAIIKKLDISYPTYTKLYNAGIGILKNELGIGA